MNRNEYYQKAVEQLKRILQSEDLEEIENRRKRVYERFREDFQNIDNLSKERFHYFLSFEGNEHWTNLERYKNKITKDMDLLRKTLHLYLDDEVPLGQRIKTKINTNNNKINGLGKATSSAFLLVASEGGYAIWNNTSEDVLKALRIWPLTDSAEFNGKNYEDLNEFLIQLSKDVSIDLWTLDHLFWRMRDRKAEVSPQIFPDEIREDEEVKYPEGGRKKVTVNAYERNPEAREKCIEHYGPTCRVCDFNFGKAYGDKYKRFIHIHHIKPVSKMPKRYEVDPVKDLIPVCPNCHAVIHYGNKTLSIEAVKKLLEK